MVFFIFGFQFAEKLQETSRWFSGFMGGIQAPVRLLVLPLFNENTLMAVTAVGLQLVDTLPEEMRPGPDFHGLPWEPVIITALVGIVTLAIFFWRTCLSVSILHACKPADVSLTDWSSVWLNCFSITGVKAICSLLCFYFFC